MKLIITIIVVLAVASAALAVSTTIWPWQSPPPKEQYNFTETDGGLQATYHITINNSPALVTTSAQVDEAAGVVHLHFVCIQNGDLYKRSQRWQELAWKLPQLDRSKYRFQLAGQKVVVNTSELQPLLPADKP